MTDMNTFLRRADVEALIETKMKACDEKIERHRKIIAEAGSTTSSATLIEHAQEMIDYAARRSALGSAKSHLKFCEQFTLATANGEPTLLREGNAVVEVIAS